MVLGHCYWVRCCRESTAPCGEARIDNAKLQNGRMLQRAVLHLCDVGRTASGVVAANGRRESGLGRICTSRIS